MKKALLALAIIASFISGYYKGKLGERKRCDQITEPLKSLGTYNFVSKDGKELAGTICSVSAKGIECFTVKKGEPQ